MKGTQLDMDNPVCSRHTTHDACNDKRHEALSSKLVNGMWRGSRTPNHRNVISVWQSDDCISFSRLGHEKAMGGFLGRVALSLFSENHVFLYGCVVETNLRQ